ncbi:uncharacterized protein LOC117607449 [Osmia lignaria lignaria]|uniref:uncharacterized protein LOC117607449 n=1 Tax=Osmia lignaria lignaria TaxID=1437193 RepID=UPI00147859CB|nr:uncharacterized protein LOC117607449 [Osmia lignaria]
MDYPEGQYQVSYFRTMWTAVASMGWYILALAICCWYASPYIRERYTRWKLRKDEEDYAAKFHKNPDLLQDRLSALEASRQRMQEKYYQKCVQSKEEEREKEIRKEASRLIDSSSTGYRLGSASDESTFVQKKSKSLRGDYNPLMGDNSRGYRPPKRSCCGKGGCG